MAKVTPVEFAEKWKRRMSQSTEDIRRGIDRVSEAPGVKAAAAADRMVQNLTESVTSGRWGRKVSEVSLADWKNAAKEKGLARVATGAAQAEAKMARIAAELLPAVDAAAAEANALPKGTIDDSINRAATFMRRMREFKDRS